MAEKKEKTPQKIKIIDSYFFSGWAPVEFVEEVIEKVVKEVVPEYFPHGDMELILKEI